MQWFFFKCCSSSSTHPTVIFFIQITLYSWASKGRLQYTSIRLEQTNNSKNELVAEQQKEKKKKKSVNIYNFKINAKIKPTEEKGRSSFTPKLLYLHKLFTVYRSSNLLVSSSYHTPYRMPCKQKVASLYVVLLMKSPKPLSLESVLTSND